MQLRWNRTLHLLDRESVLLKSVLDLLASLLQVALGLVALSFGLQAFVTVASPVASLPLPPSFSAAFLILSSKPMVFLPMVGSRRYVASG